MLAMARALAHAQDVQQVWRGERMTIVFRAGAVGNLAWQLDTLSGHSNTKAKDYTDLWRHDLAWSSEDAQQLERWSVLHSRYRGAKTENRNGKSPYPPNYGRFYGTAVSRDAAFRIAALDAPDLATLRSKYEELCGRACAGRFVGILRHFWPRFSDWWQHEGLTTASKLVPQIVSKTSDSDLGNVCQSAIALTNAQVPARATVALDLAIHPKKYLTNTTATVLEGHLLIEVVDDPKIGAPPLATAIHEFTHHFYDLAPRPDHVRLIERFLQRPEPYSMAAYSILNEVVAASVQLLAEKKSRSLEDFNGFASKDDNIYFDPFISKVVRLTSPLIEQRIAASQEYL